MRTIIRILHGNKERPKLTNTLTPSSPTYTTSHVRTPLLYKNEAPFPHRKRVKLEVLHGHAIQNRKFRLKKMKLPSQHLIAVNEAKREVQPGNRTTVPPVAARGRETVTPERNSEAALRRPATADPAAKAGAGTRTRIWGESVRDSGMGWHE